MSGQIDLAVLALLSGDVGAAENALPKLLEAAAATKGWHQWLWTARIRALAAELELQPAGSDKPPKPRTAPSSTPSITGG